MKSLDVSRIEGMLRKSGGAHQVQFYDWECRPSNCTAVAAAVAAADSDL